MIKSVIINKNQIIALFSTGNRKCNKCGKQVHISKEADDVNLHN